MKRKRQMWLGGIALALAAVMVWVRDLQWMSAPADTLPLTLGLLVAYIIGQPWQAATPPLPAIHVPMVGGGGLVFACAWIFGSLTLLAMGWTLLAMVWVCWSFEAQARRMRLAWLLLLSFPWLVIDWPVIGLAFRLSSAVVAEQVFGFLQMPIQRHGTLLEILGVPVKIEASCAGWNLLQLTLLVGVAIGTYEIRSSRRFVLLLGLLPAIAWCANLLRILLLTGVALSFDSQVASGSIHGFAGLVVLGAVLVLTKGLCFLIDPPTHVSSRILKAS